jgi:hypothetical protein
VTDAEIVAKAEAVIAQLKQEHSLPDVGLILMLAFPTLVLTERPESLGMFVKDGNQLLAEAAHRVKKVKRLR